MEILFISQELPAKPDHIDPPLNATGPNLKDADSYVAKYVYSEVSSIQTNGTHLLLILDIFLLIDSSACVKDLSA